VIVLDDMGREIPLAAPPARIVSLVPSVSETLWYLGVGERLVGVTRYCTHPREVAALPRCGGTKNPDCERVSSLRPDLVFMSAEENRREDFQVLSQRGLAIFVCLPKTVSDVADWVLRVGRAVGCGAQAELIASATAAVLREISARATARDRPPRVFCPIWKRPWMTFNADTYADAVLRCCGAANVFSQGSTRYLSVTIEEIEAARPEVVLLPDEPYPFRERDRRELLGLLSPESTPLEVRLVDGRALSWYGAGTAEGLRTIESAIFGGAV